MTTHADMLSRWPTGRCAPTAVAGALDVPLAEAIELLLSIPEVPLLDRWGRARAVRAGPFQKWVQGYLEGRPLPTQRVDGCARWRRAREQYWATGWGREPSYAVAHQYTVSQFLRLNPHGTIIIGVRGHVLAARDGVVVADTLSNKSARRRVVYGYLIPGI